MRISSSNDCIHSLLMQTICMFTHICMLLLSKEIQQADVACHDLETDALVLGSNCTVIYVMRHKSHKSL